MLEITPKTKIAEIIKAYPELKEKIVALAPQFEKLKNPFLMKTVAKMTSLAQAAKVGALDVTEFINALRAEVGQTPLNIESAGQDSDEPPLWFKTGTIVKTIDARPMLEQGEHPVGIVMQEVDNLANGEILELITPFVPAPIIDKVEDKGFAAWTLARSNEEYKNYFSKTVS